MLRPRLIPCLLIKNNGLVKTIKFKDPKYVGDPINAVRIFNEKMVDELIVIDIDATIKHTEPNYNLISKLANECQMPLCYGGGVKKLEQLERIISLGVEKISLSSSLIDTPDLVAKAASRVGSQSVVGVMDIKKVGLLRRYEVVTHNGMKRTGKDPIIYAHELQKSGIGEIIINSVDLDGTMQGYDYDLVEKLVSAITVPVTVLGGAGDLQHCSKLWSENGIIGAAAGSLFVFKGKYRAVLINYPNPSEKKRILTQAGWSA